MGPRRGISGLVPTGPAGGAAPSVRCRTANASVSCPARVSLNASRHAGAAVVVVHGSPSGCDVDVDRSVGAVDGSGGAVGEGGLHGFRRPEGAEHLDRGDRREREIGAHVVGDRRQPEDV